MTAGRKGSFTALIITLLIALIWVFPILWMAGNSFRPNQEILSGDFTKYTFTMKNYQFVLRDAKYSKYFVNSLLVASGTTLITVAAASLAAYSMARYNTGGKVFDAVILSTRAIPPAVRMIPFNLLYRFGTPAQKQKWLAPLMSGEQIGGFAITEPGAGSDVSGVRTRAVRDDDGWRLDGNKIFITLAPVSDMMIVLASTEPEKKSRGMTCFIVEKGTPGLSVGKPEHMMGQRGVPLAEVSFDGVWIPAENQFGAYNEGFKVMMAGLDSTRLEVAALALGISQAALEEATRYAATREQFGQPIGAFQGVGFMLADMATEYEAGYLLTMRAAAMKDAKVPFTKESSMAKYFTTDNAMRHATNAVQIFGGYGCSHEYPVERLMRDIKPAQIYDGTSQIHRMIVARKLLSDYANRTGV